MPAAGKPAAGGFFRRKKTLFMLRCTAIIPFLTPKKPQSQYLSRIPALFLSREMRNVAYILSGK
jgi:hypothetical protein